MRLIKKVPFQATDDNIFVKYHFHFKMPSYIVYKTDYLPEMISCQNLVNNKIKKIIRIWLQFIRFLFTLQNNNNTYLHKACSWQTKIKQVIAQCSPPYAKLYYLPNPSTRAGYDTRSVFKRSLTGLNSEFSFSQTTCLTKMQLFFMNRANFIGFKQGQFHCLKTY